MKKFTGSVQTVSTLPTGQGPLKPLGTLEQISLKPKTVVDILKSLKKGNEYLLNSDQASALSSLKFSQSGELILNVDYFLYEVVNMLYSLEYSIVYNFLSVNWETIFGAGPELRHKILFDNPLMDPAKEKFDVQMDIFRTTVEVEMSIQSCYRCGSNQTVALQSQRRGSDEPMTIKLTCLSCNNRWTAQ